MEVRLDKPLEEFQVSETQSATLHKPKDFKKVYLRSELLHVRQYVLDDQGRRWKTRKSQLEVAYKQKQHKISINRVDETEQKQSVLVIALTLVKRFQLLKLPTKCSQLSKAQRIPNPVQMQLNTTLSLRHKHNRYKNEFLKVYSGKLAGNYSQEPGCSDYCE